MIQATGSTTTGRARPLPPEERRAALIAATLPLLAENGVKVTTRQIADAAGVAEGTIFRVFHDKESLIKAAVDAALDPVPTVAELHGIDLDLRLRERLTQMTEILQRRLTAVFNLLFALRMHGPPPPKHPAASPSHQPIVNAMIRVIEPDRTAFRLPPAEIIRILRLLTFAGSHRFITDNNPLTTDQIVSVLLDGVLRDPQPGEPC